MPTSTSPTPASSHASELSPEFAEFIEEIVKSELAAKPSSTEDGIDREDPDGLRIQQLLEGMPNVEEALQKAEQMFEERRQSKIDEHRQATQDRLQQEAKDSRSRNGWGAAIANAVAAVAAAAVGSVVASATTLVGAIVGLFASWFGTKLSDPAPQGPSGGGDPRVEEPPQK